MHPGGTCLFFFGTLMDPDVLALVLAKPLAEGALRPAVMHGFRRLFVRGRTYPMLWHHAGRQVEGVLVNDLSLQSLERLLAFEGPEYHLVRVSVRCPGGQPVTASAFLCDRAVKPHATEWAFKTWKRRYKRAYLRQAYRLMRRHDARTMPNQRARFGSKTLPRQIAGCPPGSLLAG